MYKQKHVELVAKMQNQAQNLTASEYLQILQSIQQQTPQVIQQNVTPINVTQTHHPYLGSLRQNSSEHSTDEIDMHQLGIACSKENVSGGSASRNRRAYSGSGQTISQTTRDRLKTMIASKKQKLQNSCSTGSNVSLNSSSTFTNWIPPNTSKITTCELNLGTTSIAQQKNNCASNIPVTSNHFEPYPHPSPVTSANATSSEFQLRKVNSEPNLKMRIRARLLNKGSSPGTAGLPNQTTSGSNNSINHTLIQR